tara:strand:- start:225 stop:683 length:459 start_codon:yes stop_codon:yes gene_type:complete
MSYNYLENVQNLNREHRLRLDWFYENSDKITGWPDKVSNKYLLVSKAKGIFKPRDLKYALSVRENIDSSYDDKKVMYGENNQWTYTYHQEGFTSEDLKSLYTNRSLTYCFMDKIPVGVIKQIKKKPDPEYLILGCALVDTISNNHFVLKGLN